MARFVTFSNGWRMQSVPWLSGEDGKPRLKFSFVNDETDERLNDIVMHIDDVYLMRNMINSELDDAYVPIVVDPEDAA